MFVVDTWKDYELIDCSRGEKLERWKDIYLLRPDPQIIWDNGNLREKYKNINAHYHRSNKGGGYWENLKETKETWTINYKNLTFNIKEMGFKHTGLFPEQAVNWDFMNNKIKEAKKDSNKEVKVLNLFAYTGGATVACLSAGASVVHVDSSRGMVEWAKENVNSSNLSTSFVRYIVDDVLKFVKREIRRGNKYDAIIMDPPSYGRGANNEVWDIEKDLFNLVKLCNELLSENPLFFIINTYTTGLSKEVFTNILKTTVLKKHKGKVYSEELVLPIKNSDLVLPCGITSRFENE
ncbi:MAG: class I SAM-dependent methyltransferase [Bacilli bacterium]|nr:class I SAM-dependent methyltransferase [Bacilli bacterium]